jgi:hypothetical protein
MCSEVVKAYGNNIRHGVCFFIARPVRLVEVSRYPATPLISERFDITYTHSDVKQDDRYVHDT